MRKSLLAVGLLLAVVTSAQAGPLGVGIIVGEPTALSAKKWLDDKRALDLAIGWSLREKGKLHLHGDFLLHPLEFAITTQDSAQFCYGVGGRLRVQEDKDPRLGVRIPVGVSYMFRNQPLEVFVEIGAVMDLVPETELDLGAGLGVRFYFRPN